MRVCVQSMQNNPIACSQTSFDCRLQNSGGTLSKYFALVRRHLHRNGNPTIFNTKADVGIYFMVKT